MGNSSQRQCRKSQLQIRRKCNAGGSGVSIPFIAFMKAHLWTTRGRPYKFATGGNRSVLTLAGLVPSAGLSARPAHAAGGTLRQRGTFHAGCYAQGTLTQRVLRQIPFSLGKTLPAGNQSRIRQNGGNGAWRFSLYSKDCWTQQRKIHHIGVCLSQWRCDENEETGRISYYTSKEVVYTSLLMCENAPQEWQNVPAENIRRFQKSVRYKRQITKMLHWKIQTYFSEAAFME